MSRPSAQAVEYHLRAGERNPIKGKFGQAKTGYGLNRIKSRLKDTSQSWIAAIILVLTWSNWLGKYCCAWVFQRGRPSCVHY
ncbi:transposase [Algoriphagus boritolerans]|nr:transposase [Algoriphagus boritolerans]